MGRLYPDTLSPIGITPLQGRASRMATQPIVPVPAEQDNKYIRALLRGAEEELVPFAPQIGKKIIPGEYEKRPEDVGFGVGATELVGRLLGMAPSFAVGGGVAKGITSIPKVAKVIQTLSKAGRVGTAAARAIPGAIQFGTVGALQQAETPQERLRKTGEYMTTGAVAEGILAPLFGKAWRSIIGKKAPAEVVEEAGKKATKMGLDEKGVKGKIIPVIEEAKTVLPKLEVGGGKYATERFGLPEDIDKIFRETAKKIEPQIKFERRGKVSWDKTFQDAETKTIAKILERERGEAANASYIAASAQHISATQRRVFELTEQLKNAVAENAPRATIDTLELELKQAFAFNTALIQKALGASAEAGRALNIHKAINRVLLTPQIQLQKELIKENWPNIDLVLKNLMRFDSDDTVGMMKYLSKIKPTTPAEGVEAIWYNSILSGIATNLANAIGNLSKTTYHLATKPFRVGVDIIRSKWTNAPREEFMREMGPEVVGSIKGFKDGVRRAVFAWNNGFRFEDVANLRIPRIKMGAISSKINIPSRALVALDELFRGININMEIYRQATKTAIKEGLKGQEFNTRVAELIQLPTAEMTKKANELATELLFQKMSAELITAGALRDFAKFDIPKWGTIRPMRFVIPFVQVPINIAKWGVETGPIGIATTLMQGQTKLGAEEFNRKMASGILGSLITAAFAMYFTEDKLTGRVPKTPKEKDAFFASKKIPYAMRIGDTWVQYSRIDPFASWLTALAVLHDQFEDGVNIAEAAPNFFLAYAGMFADRTYMQGIRNIMDALEEPERYGKNVKRVLASILTPFSSFLRSIAQFQEREIKDPESLVDFMRVQIPGLIGKVPGKESAFEPGGTAIRKYPAWQEFVPWKTVSGKGDPLAEIYLEQLKRKRELKKTLEGLMGK